jgi:hypothetical protein
MNDLTIEPPADEAGTNGAGATEPPPPAEPLVEEVPFEEVDSLRLRVAELEEELADERLRTAAAAFERATLARTKQRAELAAKYSENDRYELLDSPKDVIRRRLRTTP